MPILIRAALALIFTGGLSYGIYALAPLLEKQLKMTFLSDFKFFPLVIAAFLALSAVDYLLGWIERRFFASPGKDRPV